MHSAIRLFDRGIVQLGAQAGLYVRNILLPQEARDYVEYLEKAIGCKITYISVGAEREAYIHHNV